MSRRIERAVTYLSFDARDFKRGIQNALGDLGLLKRNMRFDGVAKTFGDIEKASNQVKFDQMGQNIDSTISRFSALGVIGATVINRITNAILDAGKDVFQKAFVEPMRTGLDEYETQMNSIQTILANTSHKGTMLEDVQSALDELNEYADLTIYNFTQMTENIGKFTAAGVDLDVSVQAIKGIANLAAVSGSSSQQASVAMYQLSQAISSGTVRLMDWNSVVNAGMGGEVFQNALIETARVSGVAIDEILEASGGFRNSLQEEWLTSQIMLDTLAKFTGDLSRAQLESLGYTNEQIDEIIEMGQMANDAATKIKTLTQLFDTMAEAMQSGWSLSWRLIIGDFEEAKEAFGAIGEVFSGAIEKSAYARNRVLNVWRIRGGRELLVEGLITMFQALLEIMDHFKDAVGDVFAPLRGGHLYNATVAFKNFADWLKMGGDEAEKFKSIIRGVASILDIFFMLIGAILKPILILVSGLAGVSGGAFDVAAGLGDMIYGFRNFLKETGFFEGVVQTIIQQVKRAASAIRTLAAEFMDLQIVKDVVGYFSSLTKSDFVAVFDSAMEILNSVIRALKIAALTVAILVEDFMALEEVQEILAWFQKFTWDRVRAFFDDMVAQIPTAISAFNDFKAEIVRIIDKVKEMRDTFLNSDGIQAVLHYISTFDGRRWLSFVDSAKEGFSWVNTLMEKLKIGLEWLKTAGSYIGGLLSELGARTREGVEEMIRSLAVADGEINFDGLIGAVNAGLLGALALGLSKLFTGGFRKILDRYFGPASPLVTAVVDTFSALEKAITSWQTNIKADTLLKIAGAIAIVTASVVALTLVDHTKLLAAVGAISLMMAELAATAAILGRTGSGGLGTAGATIIALAAGVSILAIAVRNMGSLDPVVLSAGIENTGYAILGLVAAIKVLSIGPLAAGLIKATIAMGLMAVSLSILHGVIYKFGTTDPDIMAVGLIAMGAALLELVTAFKILALGTMPTGLIATSIAVGILAFAMDRLRLTIVNFGRMNTSHVKKGLIRLGVTMAALVVFFKFASSPGTLAGGLAVLALSKGVAKLAEVISGMADVEWDTIVKGLTAISLVLIAFAGASYAMQGAIMGVVGIIAMVGGIFLLAEALKVLGGLEWEEIWKGLGAVALGFGLIALAAALLTPLIPSMIGLGMAMGLIGLGAFGMGVGVTLAAGGLVLLGKSSEIVAKGIREVGMAIIEIIPELATAIATGVSNFIQTLFEAAPEIIEAGKTAFLSLVAAVEEVVPELIAAGLRMLKEFLKSLLAEAPSIVDTGYKLLIELLTAVRDNIHEVVELGLEIATEFITGLTDGIPALVDAAYEFIFEFTKAVVEGWNEHIGPVVEEFRTRGGEAIVGFINGMWDRVQELINSARSLAAIGLEEFLSIFKFGSPSKVLRKYGGWAIEGFIIGMYRMGDALKYAVSKTSEKAQNGIEKLTEAFHNVFEADSRFSPVITPVLDLGGITSSMDQLDRDLSVGARAYMVYGSLDRTSSVAAQGPSAPESSGVTYIQNNYSPKALNRGEIFRKTRSQLALLDKRSLS